MEDLLRAKSVHGGEEEEEVPPEMKKTRCNKNSNELESNDEAAEELEEAYLEELTKNKVKGQHKGKWQKQKMKTFAFPKCIQNVIQKCLEKMTKRYTGNR